MLLPVPAFKIKTDNNKCKKKRAQSFMVNRGAAKMERVR